MSPIPESQLRDALAHVHVRTPSSDEELTAAVISRGRGIRRRRTAVGVLAVTLVTIGGLTLGANMLSREQAVPAAPATTSTATSEPEANATPRTSTPVETSAPASTASHARWTSDTGFPMDFGPEQDRCFRFPSDGPVNDFTFGCTDEGQPFTLSTLRTVIAGQNAVVNESEGAARYAGLRFGSASEAEAFMAQFAEAPYACVEATETPGSTGGPGVQKRQIHEVRETAGSTQDEDLTLVSYFQASTDGGRTWTDSPGSALTYLARNGTLVGLAEFSGEWEGDMSTDAAANTTLRNQLDAILR